MIFSDKYFYCFKLFSLIFKDNDINMKIIENKVICIKFIFKKIGIIKNKLKIF